VVLIAIAALAYFGLLNPSRFLPDKCEFQPGLSCPAFSADGNSTGGSLTFFVTNGVGVPMRNINFSVQCENGRVHHTNSTGQTTLIPLLTEGQTQLFNISGCPGVYPNSRFTGDVYVDYEVRVDGQTMSRANRGRISVQVN
ncbi:MAG: hypothetical protein ACMXYE_04685, partial [Candidatus Woesearchaeota archaeon]